VVLEKACYGLSGILLLLWGALVHAEEQGRWNETLRRVSTGVVAIRVDAARAFDTANNSSTQATGFVVDAEQGLILTNRHVVQSGPVVAEAFFENREEVVLTPIYRDPVHDFGFFRYDPAALKYIQPATLSLRPEAAQVGREIRVIGNDAGEQRSILSGTLARLDRSAPYYGFGQYNDFNTFYLQAASGVSGGSSGSPVVDLQGDVLGLNAGGNQTAASSFFLPLERVARALELVREGRPVSRGGLLTTFDYLPFNELRRLGLRPQTEAELRALGKGIGMLVVSAVLPEGPADGLLQPGDVLIKLEGRRLNHFAELEAVLDERVGGSVLLQVERGGEPLELWVPVVDLHGVTPDRYLSLGDGVLNDLSYQQARQLHKPLRGVYVASPGYVLGSAGVPVGAVIVDMEGQEVRDLGGLSRMLSGLADGQQVVLRFFTFREPNREQVAVMTMDRRWFPVEVCRRDDRVGYWPCESVPLMGPSAPARGGTVRFESYRDPRAARLVPSLVYISFDIPYRLDGVAGNHYLGAGLIVDSERGLLVTDRNTVPVAMGDVRLTFSGTLEIPGRVIFVHPTHNLAFVQYDPALLGATPVRSAELDTSPLVAGDSVWLVGLNGNQRLQAHAMPVASIEPLQIPLSQVPTFRESNLESVNLNNPPSLFGGVLSDEAGRVRALWASFSYGQGKRFTQFNSGIPIALVAELLAQWRCCQSLEVHSLEVELVPLPLAKARKLGLPEAWAERIQQNGQRRQVLFVGRRVSGAPSELLLQEGDLLVAVEGQRVHDFLEVERLSNRPAVEVTVIRSGQELTFRVPTVHYAGRGTEYLVQWAGALLQRPHRAVAAQRGVAPKGAFVSYVWPGSPASRYQLSPLSRIIGIDDQPVPDLDTFLRLSAARQAQDSLRLRVVNLLGREEVITLKPDNRYWPTREIRWQGDEWRRIEHNGVRVEASHDH
jgi:S1-C subfamily serine protease